MARSPARRWVVGLAVVGAVAGLLAPAAAADTGGGPSASDVARAKAAVVQRAHELTVARAQVASTQARVSRLGQQAEIAVERYNAAELRLSRAQEQEQASAVVLDAAQQRLTRAQQRVDGFVAAAYMGGGDLALTMLVSSEGPAQFLRSSQSLDAVSLSQRNALGELAGARAYQRMVLREAHRVTVARRAASAAAEQARVAALSQVHQAQALLSTLQAEQAHVSTLLRAAMTKAQRLEAARAAALAAERAREQALAAERAREQALALARQQQEQAARARLATDAPVVVAGDPGAVALQWAMAEIGVPYAWGGGDANGPTYGISYGSGTDGFDCSGLTLFAYAHAGITLDHWTGSQWNSGPHVPVDQLRPGDLVFFATNTSDPATIHHVGIYAGNGQMVEAPYTGGYVRISSAFRPDYIGAVRPYA